MEKEPWQEDIYNNEESRSERRSRGNKGTGVVANRILTILACIFFVIVVGMIAVLIYLSSGGSDRFGKDGCRGACCRSGGEFSHG